jgi:predicted metal-dependent hydrolase
MQFVLPFDVRGPEAKPPAPPASEPLEVVRNARARRYVLRVRPDGSVRVTIPRHGTKRDALLFARDQAEWIARQRARVAANARPPDPWRAGRLLWLRGELVPLSVTTDGSQAHVWVGGGGVPVVAGTTCLRRTVHAHLRAKATDELPPRVRGLAAEHGLTIVTVTIRDQRTRWGSCSTSGRISLNWRLVQMPAHVRDYVIVHELMHLRQANHSRKFWKLVEAAYPSFREAKAWLRRHGSELL